MKTLDQAVKDYVQPMVDEGMPELDIVFSSADFKNGVEFAQKWISVEDELPDILTEVLLKLSNGKILLGYISKDVLNKYGTLKVTYWRPIEIK